jgi:hypothetical protein
MYIPYQTIDSISRGKFRHGTYSFSTSRSAESADMDPADYYGNAIREMMYRGFNLKTENAGPYYL